MLKMINKSVIKVLAYNSIVQFTTKTFNLLVNFQKPNQ